MLLWLTAGVGWLIQIKFYWDSHTNFILCVIRWRKWKTFYSRHKIQRFAIKQIRSGAFCNMATDQIAGTVPCSPRLIASGG
jgi:hypothetical protein